MRVMGLSGNDFSKDAGLLCYGRVWFQPEYQFNLKLFPGLYQERTAIRRYLDFRHLKKGLHVLPVSTFF